MAYTPGSNQYVRSNTGVWTPVGYATGDLTIPASLRDTTGVLTANRADGYLNVRMDPSTLLFDTFETLDTANTWTLSGTTVPSGANGLLTVSAGLPASAQSYARSQPSFTPGSGAYLIPAILVTLDAAAVTGNKRVWGLGVFPATPTVSVPIANGVVFEAQDTDGSLIGATYSNSVRTQTVAINRPTDGNVHRYSAFYKASRVYFELDNVTVGSLPFPNPQVSALALLIASVNGATALTTAATLTSSLMGIADSGRNSISIADGKFQWRELTIKAPSTAAVATDLPAVVAMHPSSPLPAGTNAVGSVSVNNFPATQPVSIATNTPDVTDRAGRLLGVLSAGTNSIGTVQQNLAPTGTLGTSSGNIAPPFYEAGTAAAASGVVIAAPGAGLSLYVTDMEGTNEGTAATALVFLEGTTTKYRRFMAASGGGFVTNLGGFWKLPANTGLSRQVTVATTWNYTINYYVAP